MNLEDVSLENVQKDSTDYMHVALNTPINDHELSSFNPNNMFLMGYTECARETLRYLTEVEKLPANHPVIIRLKLHLYEQFNVFQIQRMLRTALTIRDKEDDNLEARSDETNNNESDLSKKDSTNKCSEDEKSDLEKTNMGHADNMTHKCSNVTRKQRRK
jgi:hypothetical protein